MGYEDLIQSLLRDAESRAAEIVRRAREEAGQIVDQAKTEARAMEKRLEEDLAAEMERRRRIRLNQIRMEASALVLQARVSLLEEIFSALEDRLRELPKRKDYPTLIERLYEEILPELPEGRLVIRADSKAQPVIKRLAARREVRIEPLPEEEIGGLEVSDENQTVRVRNTFRSRLIKARPHLMIEANRRLSEADA